MFVKKLICTISVSWNSCIDTGYSISNQKIRINQVLHFFNVIQNYRKKIIISQNEPAFYEHKRLHFDF